MTGISDTFVSGKDYFTCKGQGLAPDWLYSFDVYFPMPDLILCLASIPHPKPRWVLSEMV